MNIRLASRGWKLNFSLPLASAGVAMEYFLHLIASLLKGNKDLLLIKRQDLLSRYIGCFLALEVINHASLFGAQ